MGIIDQDGHCDRGGNGLSNRLATRGQEREGTRMRETRGLRVSDHGEIRQGCARKCEAEPSPGRCSDPFWNPSS